jgi:hypothetical protein
MNIKNTLKISCFLALFSVILQSCGPPGDARKVPVNPDERVKKNIEEGRGFRLMEKFGGNNGNFEFASSNELWRASLDTLDFMPLASVNYSGGLIITDWYSTDAASNESIKISIRFLTNEVRSDALDIKVFKKKCAIQSSCVISQKSGKIVPELKRKILKMAALYEKEKKKKNFKPYKGLDSKID